MHANQKHLILILELDPTREDALNSINFVWNTVTAMWEERFRRLSEWKKVHGHCAVPIAQGELGTWVSKQRQLRKRGKLSPEKVDALNSLKFTWSTAEADWEDKFKRLCEWTRERGHASVPFNEGELGWWVNTQRQCKRKGKLSSSRESRLESLGFVWNPSNSRSRTSNTTNTQNSFNAMSSVGTTPSSTPKKCEKITVEEEANAILQLFATEPPTQVMDMEPELGILQANHSPVSAVAEHNPVQMTPPSPSNELLLSPPQAILSQNLWSPTIFSSPRFTSGFTSFNIPNSIHEPIGSSQHLLLGSTTASPSDLLDHLFTKDEDYVLEQANIDSLICDEEL